MGFEHGRRSGQAMAEFVIALLAMTLIIMATVEFLPILLENFALLKEVREEAGGASIASEAGTSSAERQEEFASDIPDLLMDGDATSGHFSERMHMPAANLTTYETVRIPSIAGATETLRYSNRAGTSEFVSARTFLSPSEAIARAAGTMSGAGWRLHRICADDARLFTVGDETAPSAVAAVHAMQAAESTDDGYGPTVLTITARTAGATL